jgi:phosphoserine phosphatase
VLRVNSFPYWVLFLIAGPIRGIGVAARLRLAHRAAWLLLLRKLRLIDHRALLSGLQRAWWAIASPVTGAATDPLQKLLLRRVRPNLWPLLQMVASGRVEALMASAAAGEYAEGLGLRLGFRHMLVTPPARARCEPINSGSRKRDRVLAFLQAAGWGDRPLILLTDHIDDLPLMRHSTLVCWFGPAEKAQEANEAAEGVDVVLCRHLTARQILDTIEKVVDLPVVSAVQAARLSSITAA